MRQFLLCLTAFLGLMTLSGQTQFQMRYGSPYSDDAKKTIQTQDGNFIIVGATTGFGSSGNALIMKINAAGAILWSKDYSGINQDIIYDVMELPDKKLVMCGTTNSFGAGSTDAFVMKTDSVGNMIWGKVYGSIGEEVFLKIIGDGETGVFLSGYYAFSNAFGSIITRIDSVGNVLWTKEINDNILGDECLALVSGDVLFAEHAGDNSTFSVYKFSPTGNVIWSNNYITPAGSSGLSGLSILSKSNGDIAVNFAISDSNTVAQAFDQFILTLDNSGTLISAKSYGGTYTDDARSIVYTSDGGIMMCGVTNSAGNGDMDACLIKLSPAGNVQWAKAYGTVWEEETVNAVQTPDKGFVFTGHTFAVGSLPDSCKVYFVRTDSVGNSSCHYVSWTPTVNSHTFSTAPATLPVNHSFSEGQVNWALNNRSFYTANICNPVSIEERGSVDNNWSIYPNPFSSGATLQAEIFLEDVTFTITNYLGQAVKEMSGVAGQTFTFSRDNLKSGFYFIHLSKDGRIQGSKKIVITD